MLIALAFIVTEAVILITYMLRRARGAELPALNTVNIRNLLLATMSTASGYALTRHYDLGGTDVVPLLLLGCVLPTLAGTALGNTSQSWARLTWLPAVLGGLAVGSVNPDAPWPW
ncbi:hypothetical protein ACF1BR_11335 [Streptomyces rubiginosohelvolus]|uniref:hypothetical protein n=1 Tax=Streptomyces rubiginosohelvolus TaxID=67362 RepID=UPI003400C0E1